MSQSSNFPGEFTALPPPLQLCARYLEEEEMGFLIDEAGDRTFCMFTC